MTLNKTTAVVPQILIVDDDNLVLCILSSLLKDAGFMVVEASTLADARQAAIEHRVSLVLLDVHLPDGDSLDFCRELVNRSDTPVLFISADDDLHSKTDGFAAGAVDYITKPLAGPEVLARVRTHLRLVAARMELAAFHKQQLSRIEITQQAMMVRPENLPDARFAVFLKQVLPAGGDFYDVLALGDNIFDYILADASGHDLGSSLWTAVLKALLSQNVSAIDSPMEICRSINKTLCSLLPSGIFFTMLYLRLNRATGKLVIVSAGHPAALYFSSESSSTSVLEQSGDVLGVYNDAVFGEISIGVKPQDRLFLYSDGLLDVCGSDRDTLDCFRDVCIKTAGQGLQPAVMDLVSALVGEKTPKDDIVLMGIEV